MSRAGYEAYKRILTYSVTVRISAKNYVLLKSYITKVLEYNGDLNRRIKFVCVAMCSLMMSSCSCDLFKVAGSYQKRLHKINCSRN